MLYLYQSSGLKLLAVNFLEATQKSGSNVLQPDFVVLQNSQMKRWLQKFIAREKGIAANIQAHLPGQFIWDLYHQMDSTLPATLPCEREPMQFSIFEILQSGEHAKQLQPLYDYMQAGGKDSEPERAWNLSGRIADLFDRYQIYRPEMILKWQNNGLHTHSKDEKWQSTLWQLLQKKWDDLLGDSKHKNRVELYNAFIKSVKAGTFSKHQLPDKISIFAVPALAPVFMETFIQLSRVIDVAFYRLDVGQIDNLPESWAKKGEEFVALFDKYVKEHNIDYKATDAIVSNDGISRSSIQVHSCHSAMREVEVLYDQLLAMFDKDPELDPADVLISTPDIETYTPLIHAVFGSPEDGQPAIPYHVLGLNGTQGAYAQSFIKLLGILHTRFKVTEVLDLLFQEPVREAFGISEDDVGRLERWIDENNIRWGIDASFKAASGLPATNHFTWQTGMNRMMLGTVMEPSETQLLNEVFPYAEMATSEDAILSGKLALFLQELFSLRQIVEKSGTITPWTNILKKAARTFLSNNFERRDELIALMQSIEKLSTLQQITGFDRKVPFKIMTMWLQNELEENGRRGGGGYGVTFSSMVETRGIPFKMMGMIGMNVDAFPRRGASSDFDLMKVTTKVGDPDRLKEDRYLFLEMLASARPYCYFSYIGQSNRVEAEFPPSVLISELLDGLKGQHSINSEAGIQKHPLQNFSRSYFKSDKIFTYSKGREIVARELANGNPEKKSWLGSSVLRPEDRSGTLFIDDLVAYYQNTAKYLLNNELGLIIKDEIIIDDDRELFGLHGLGKYGVKQELIRIYLQNHSFEGLETKLNAIDFLPEGWPGERAFEQRAEDAKVFGDKIFEVNGGRSAEDIDINFDMADVKLAGKISGYYPPFFLDYRFGRRRAKDLIAWWVKHVILSASGQTSSDMTGILLTWNKGKLGEDNLSPLENPEEILADLIQGYCHGLHKVGYFFPESSFAYAKSLFKNGDADKALGAANNEWSKEVNKKNIGEGADLFVKWVCGDENPIEHPAFKETAKRFWEPFFSVFNKHPK